MKQPASIPPLSSGNAIARHTAKVVQMVHELHKAGYQLLHISPGLSPSGIHWRCPITCAANVKPDGFTVINSTEASGLYVPYSSAQPGYFGWADAEHMAARELAARFLSEFQPLAQAGFGRDWPYAGWLIEVLGVVERGNTQEYPIFYADYPLGPDARSVPPPPPPR
ncbi:MAG: hypothetical protein ACRYHQ_31645 [Janthinobacterium lividum]